MFQPNSGGDGSKYDWLRHKVVQSQKEDVMFLAAVLIHLAGPENTFLFCFG